MLGVDVSLDQGQIDFCALRGAGVQFVFAKATEGLTYADGFFRTNHNAAKVAGIPFGAYHFVRFNDDPTAQANHFLSVINGYGGALLPMIDVETSDIPMTLDDRIAALATLCNTVQAAIGKRPIIYSSYGFWEGTMGGTDAFAGHPFWIAQYPNTYVPGSSPVLPPGFSDWVIWQYSSAGQLAGIDPEVDLDILNPSLTLETITR